ncbi:MAG: M20/M25/M40 family metallo-hydrolase [Flavicella sp.]
MKKTTILLTILSFYWGKSQTKLEAIITNSLVEKHIATLSSDEMQGRKSGTEGIEKAAQYIESQFSQMGLKTFQGSKDYRQRFTKRGLDLFNVIGVLEGTTNKDEFVVVSAHYDHLGILPTKNGDSIANGADDDASGVAGVLALAKYYKEKATNKRSIVFIAFTAEEMGLWGSNYFGTTISPEKFIAGINLEMIGKNAKFGPNTAFLTGFDSSSFGKIIQKNLKDFDFKLYPDPYKEFRLFFRSDNASLAKLGIPAHTFSTCPIDKDPYYHTVDDEIETLDMTTVRHTIHAVVKGTESIIQGTDTPTRVKSNSRYN